MVKAFDQLAARIERQMMDSLLGACTSAVPQAQEPFTFDKLLAAVESLGPPPPPNAGRIVESAAMVDRFEDWSKVRSPSRTRRRMKYNAHRIYTYKPKTYALQLPDGSLVMHPVMADYIRRNVPEARSVGSRDTVKFSLP